MNNQSSKPVKTARPTRARLICSIAALALAALASAGAAAQKYSEPPRGSTERTDLLDAIRPLAQWAFDPPVEFVVREMRVAADVAFVSVSAQRPGGDPIDAATSPVVLRDGESPDLVDGPQLQALMQRSGRMWVPVQHSVGATDAWYCADVFATIWKTVLPEICTR